MLGDGISGLEYAVDNSLNGMGNSFGLWEEGSFMQMLSSQKIGPEKSCDCGAVHIFPLRFCAAFPPLLRQWNLPIFFGKTNPASLQLNINKCFLLEKELYAGCAFSLDVFGGIPLPLLFAVFILSAVFAPLSCSHSTFSQAGCDSTFSHSTL